MFSLKNRIIHQEPIILQHTTSFPSAKLPWLRGDGGHPSQARHSHKLVTSQTHSFPLKSRMKRYVLKKTPPPLNEKKCKYVYYCLYSEPNNKQNAFTEYIQFT